MYYFVRHFGIHMDVKRFLAIAAMAVFFPSQTFADQLTLYFYPAPWHTHWSNPRSLTVSVFENTFLPESFPLRHSIGHASVRLKCGDREILTGMTNSDDSEEQNAILKNQEGLGVLFQTFGGRLQEPLEIQTDLDARIPERKVASLSIQISASGCARLTDYYTEYRDRGYSRSYGLTLRPRYEEGGGCSAFAVSFLDVAGLLSPEFTRAWTRTLQVPLNLIRYDDHKVSIWSLLFSLQSWS